MLSKRELIEKISLLDERFGPGNFEDDDLCLRAALAGYRDLIAGDVFIHHYGSRSFNNAYAFMNLGFTCIQLGKFEEGLAASKRALELSPQMDVDKDV